MSRAATLLIGYFSKGIRYSVFITLPLFFILDALNQFPGWIPSRSAFEVFLLIFAALLLVYKLVRFVFSPEKSQIVLVWVVVIYLFFKTIKDWLVVKAAMKLFTSYSMYLTLLFVLTVLLLVGLRKMKTAAASKLTGYLSFVFLVVCLFELSQLLFTITNKRATPFKTAEIKFTDLADTTYPDVYVLQLDEYAGLHTLGKIFRASNQKFVDDLAARRFHVVKSPNSNYNGTAFSVLSLLNMGYIEGLNRDEIASAVAYNKSVAAINKNLLMPFFRENGYRISNHSFFDIDKTESLDYLFLPIKKRLMLDKTFGSVLTNDLLCSINSNSFHFLINDFPAKIDNYNQEVIKRSHETIQTTKGRVFMFAHLMMPHAPYLRDSSGNLKNIGEAYRESNKGLNSASYLQYSNYSNTVVLEMIDLIKARRPNSVIVLLSDHGLRNIKNANSKYHEFNNFVAIYSPQQTQYQIPDSLCTVNVFRYILNSHFGQNFPLLENKMVNVNITKADEAARY
ncbi:sulfatase-like hydrolase/transferase [Lacibacter sediminis]|uniref:Sulfatase-like hydrolase/transferase n=1 Tax=Lacibacter sediminis TaxID=2760713 RepID=A0A7G5XK12_9BACT|nr:sulfatase-like hydrolase/transferase [Lacibacter sediminis]QNA45815.1 sulfatase-like hydrolase/transferase [Lacibacter sediminis]